MNRERIGKYEVTALAVLLTLAFAAFLPWTHNLMIAGVSLLAWILWVLMVTAFLVGAVLAYRSPRE